MLSKKFVAMLVLFMAVMLSSTVFAQSSPGDRAGRAADKLYRDLNLTDEQYSKVYQSLLTYYSKDPVRDSDWETVKTSMTSVLNKDQMTSFSTIDPNSLLSRRTTRITKPTTDPKTPGEAEKKAEDKK